MFTVALLDPASLSLQLRQAFAELTEPKCRHCLEGETFYSISDTIPITIGAFINLEMAVQGDKVMQDFELEPLAMGADHSQMVKAAPIANGYGSKDCGNLSPSTAVSRINEQPIGLLLASFIPMFNLIEIHSLFVKQEHRNRKVATQMLSLLEKQARQKHSTLITLIYPIDDPTTPYLEQLLQTQSWSSPRLFGLTCRFDSLIFNPPWLTREYPLSPQFQIFPWKDLTPDEETILRHRKAQGEIPTPLSPFKNEKMLESLNSLGLRYCNKVVGWMITHRISLDTIQYSALYIFKEFQYRKEAIILLQNAIKLQLKSSVRWGVLDMRIVHAEPSWLAFVKHRLIPYAESVKYLKQAHRSLHEQ